MVDHGAVRAEYDAAAADYDRRWATYNRRSREVLAGYLSPGRLGRVLDLACGTGALRPAVMHADGGARYVGVDGSTGMLATAARGAQTGRWVAADALRLPFRAASFDLLICGSALHFVSPPRAALAEVRRVLRPGGRLLLMDWAADHPPVRLLDLWLRARGRSAGAWTTGQAAAATRAAGLHVGSARRHRLSAVWQVWVIDALAP